MQKRIGSLEEENRALRREYSKLADDTDECEAQEQRLVNDITLRLGEFAYFILPHYIKHFPRMYFILMQWTRYRNVHKILFYNLSY